MTADVFTHPWLSGLFGDTETADLISPQAQLAHMQRVEAAYARALGEAGAVPQEQARIAADAIEADPVGMLPLHDGTARDGVVIPSLVHALKSAVPPEAHDAVHAGLTSQDVIDTALVLSLRDVCNLFHTRLETLVKDLQRLSDTHGLNRLTGRTRMQAALPITATDRLRVWSDPLIVHVARIDQLRPRLLQLQLGGAAGDRKALGRFAGTVSTQMAHALQLENPPDCWHSNREPVAEFASWLSLVSGTLGKMGQDVALMAQQGVDEVALSGGGGSSAMPHKQNPVLAELLVTLARYNATQLTGMHQALVHEQERSGAAWTLEWMILPQMIMTTGRSLTAARELAQRIERIGEPKG